MNDVFQWYGWWPAAARVSMMGRSQSTDEDGGGQHEAGGIRAEEAQNEPLPYEMASAIVPDDLGKFILSGQRGIEGAERAVEYLTQKAADQKGLQGERLVDAIGDVKLHAPYASRSRIIMAGGNF